MARQSIPANPIDEQILSLQRQLANCQNDLEVQQEDFQAKLKEASLSIASQKDEISRLQSENLTSTTKIDSLISIKLERDKEIEYLQEQLEMLINEKISLQNQVTNLEAKHEASRIAVRCDDLMIIEIDRLKLKVIQLEEEIEKQRSEIDSLEADKIELEQWRRRAADLEAQLTATTQIRDPMTLPLGPPALRLRDLQLRIDALTRALQT